MMRKNTKKTIILVSLVLSIIVFLLIGYVMIQVALNPESGNLETRQEIPINEDRIGTSIDHLGITSSPIPEKDLDNGIVLGILESNWDGYIHLATPQEQVTIQVSNTALDETNFLLKVFYNYEEIPFQVQGSDEWETEFLFMLDGASQVDIPIQLFRFFEVEDTISKLTIGLFVAPEYFSGSDSEFGSDLRFLLPGLMLNYELNYGFNNELILSPDEFSPSMESEFGGFSIHTNTELPGDGSIWAPSIITVEAKEDVDLTFFVNPHASFQAESFLIISMLDWEQVPMNGKPYLWVDLPHHNLTIGQHGHFTLFAPNEVGFYEFLAFIVPNPTSSNSAETFFPLEMIRFTLEVVE